MVEKQLKRCLWAEGKASQLMKNYHDCEWGRPIRGNDNLLFELLTLELFQAGLSWEISLRKRKALKEAFCQFNINLVSSMTLEDIEKLMLNRDIIQNRMKIKATINNAKIIQKIKASHITFSDYMWKFTKYEIINHTIKSPSDVPTQTRLSQEISKQMKALGFQFVGPVIIYSYLQAIGVINDHEMTCSFKNII